MSASDQRDNQFFASMKDLLSDLLTKPISSRLFNRARYDYQMIRSIDYIRRNENIVIQRTDKSKVFHLASVASYHRKSLDYMQKTKAYKEIESGINPCMNHLHQVIALVDPLLKNKAIDLQTWKRSMYPNANNIELAHLYFIPKAHKVSKSAKKNFLRTNFIQFLDRHTIETYRFIDPSTIHRHITFLRSSSSSNI